MSAELINYLPEYTPMMDSVVCSASGFDPGTFAFLPDWRLTSVIALTTSAMILAFLYMMAMFFQSQQRVASIKTELYELVVTVAIFTVLFLLLNGMCNVKTGWFFPDAGYKTSLGNFKSWADESPYYSASNYLMNFADLTLNVMSAQYLFYTFIDFVTTMEVISVPMGLGATMKPLWGLGTVVKPVLNNAFSAEAIAVVTTQAQVYVMDYGTYGMLTYFLPLGLVMRCFMPTRRIGGTLIALTCIFLFIYPWLIIFTYSVVNDSLLDSLNYFTALKSTTGEGLFTVGSSFKMFLEFAFKFLWAPDFLMMSSLFIMPIVAKIFLGGVFFPIFNTIILVTVAYHLSKTLGEEIDITNLTRMI